MKRLLVMMLILSGALHSVAKVKLIIQQPLAITANQIDTLTFKDEKDALAYLKEWHVKQTESGYLLASIDAYEKINDSLSTATLYHGPAYKWGHLDFSAVNPLVLSKMNIAAVAYQGKAIHANKIGQLIALIHQYYEEQGYPFAQVKLTLDSVKGDQLFSRVLIDPLQYTTFDTLIIHGDVNISQNFLQQYLGIKVGEPYKESLVKQIPLRIRELNFIEEIAPYNVHFALDGTKVNLYVKSRKSNQINGLLGVQQDANTIDPKYMITADFLLKLKNAFGNGESLDIAFQNLQKQSPRFNFSGSYPYIFNTRFAVDGSFDIYKKDTAYVNITAGLGIRYLLNARDYIGLSYNLQSGRIVSPNLAMIMASKRLPKEIDFATQGLQLNLAVDRTNYTRNPSKGIYLNAHALAGNRKIKPNTAITGIMDGSGFDYKALYDTFETKRYQYRVYGKLGYFQPIWGQVVLHAQYNGGYVSGGHLFMNELFQIGGFKILRGYDEQSIFVNQYHIIATELRILFDHNSYAYIFSDNGWYQSKYETLNVSQYPTSLGLGLNLDNKNGAFTIAIGVGKPPDGPLQFRNAKLHFGYIAYF